MSMYNSEMQAYRTLLSKQMYHANWYQIPIWSQLMGHIGGEDGGFPRSVPFGQYKAKLLQPTEKVVEVLTNFQHEGGYSMDIPILYPLVEPPVYGDNQLLGNEEQMKFAYMKAYVNQLRKGVIVRDGLMGEQALQNKDMIMKLMKRAKVNLTQFNQAWQGYAPYDALTKRFSKNLLATRVDGGLGLTSQSHPNFYVAGVGKATWSDTPATYETNVATGLGNLADTADHYFSTEVIENMIYYASVHKIKPAVLKDGLRYYFIIINPAQAIQLKRDTKWLDANKAAAGQIGELARIFTGQIEGIYSGAVIIVDANAPGAKVSGNSGYNALYGTVNYGNVNPVANPIDNADKKIAFLLGASAIACGQAKPLGFESESYDYNNKQTEGSYTIVGYNRSDVYDDDGFYGTAGLFKENTSSLLCATYSPSAPSWASGS